MENVSCHSHVYYDNFTGRTREYLQVDTVINGTALSLSLRSDAPNLKDIMPLFNQTVSSVYVAKIPLMNSTQ